jgi:hypothetical protein
MVVAGEQGKPTEIGVKANDAQQRGTAKGGFVNLHLFVSPEDPQYLEELRPRCRACSSASCRIVLTACGPISSGSARRLIPRLRTSGAEWPLVRGVSGARLRRPARPGDRTIPAGARARSRGDRRHLGPIATEFAKESLVSTLTIQIGQTWEAGSAADGQAARFTTREEMAPWNVEPKPEPVSNRCGGRHNRKSV